MKPCPKLIDEINGIAAKLGGEFATLGFVEGTIGNAVLGSGPFGNNDDNDNGWLLSGVVDGVGNGGSTLNIVVVPHTYDTGIMIMMTIKSVEGAGHPPMDI